MVGGKKIVETATKSAMSEKPDLGLAAHEAKILPFFENLTRTNCTSVEASSCLDHLQASHITEFIRLAFCTKSLPAEVRDI